MASSVTSVTPVTPVYSHCVGALCSYLRHSPGGTQQLVVLYLLSIGQPQPLVDTVTLRHGCEERGSGHTSINTLIQNEIEV
jgi:hypothetical protein